MPNKTKDLVITPNMTLDEAVEIFMNHSAPGMGEQLDEILGDPYDLQSGTIKVALETLTQRPPNSFIETLALCKGLVEMGIFLGFIMFSAQHDLRPAVKNKYVN